MYVVPREGLSLPDPALAGTPQYRLPPEGREVQPSEYWTRRERDGDVVVLQEVPADGIEKTEMSPDSELTGDA